jgi:nucleotide-binding universal stress UspA family protein
MTGKRQNPHFRKLLVGYDGSKESDKAVDVAFSPAECVDSSVLIFAVARPPEPSTSVELEAVLDDAKEHFEESFKKINEKAKAHDIDVRTATAVGHPAEQIIHRAEADGIDLIILGRRGRSMISGMMLG